MSAQLLLAIGVTKAVWKELPTAQKKKIREQYEKGHKGLAKIMTKNAKKLVKKTKKTAKPKKKSKGKR